MEVVDNSTVKLLYPTVLKYHTIKEMHSRDMYNKSTTIPTLVENS